MLFRSDICKKWDGKRTEKNKAENPTKMEIDLNNEIVLNDISSPIEIESTEKNTDENDNYPFEIIQYLNRISPLVYNVLKNGTITDDVCELLTNFLNFILNSHGNLFSNLIIKLNLVQISDAAITSLCSSFITPSVSSVSVSAFLYNIVAPFIQLMLVPASRSFSNALISISLSHPQCLVDSLIMPVLLDTNLGSSQCEIINKIIKVC